VGESGGELSITAHVSTDGWYPGMAVVRSEAVEAVACESGECDWWATPAGHETDKPSGT
jgi:hypothetical protein